MIKSIIPRDERHWLGLRVPVVTSTEMPALFDCSPYMTRFELHYRKRDKTLVELEATEPMKWGLRVQGAIAEGVAEEDNVACRRMHEFMFHEELRIGASFDYTHGTDGILEVKNVDFFGFKNGWTPDDDGNIEAPPHIEFQVQQQLYLSKKKYAIIAALVGGNKLIKLRREPDPKVFKALEAAALEFWLGVDNNIDPKPDFILDAELIARMYGLSEPGKLLMATEDMALKDLASQYAFAASQKAAFDREQKGLKAQILMKIDKAEKVILDGFTISAGTVAPQLIEAHERAGYRNFRITEKKAKEKSA